MMWMRWFEMMWIPLSDMSMEQAKILNKRGITTMSEYRQIEKNHADRQEAQDVCDMSLVGGAKLAPLTSSKKSADKISALCDELKRFLLVKNKRYGDSALKPVKIFSKGDASDKIDIRMDDKMSRIIESDEQRMNDFVDLTGYLVLKCIDKGWTDFSDLLD